MIQATDGNFYGTTYAGGTRGYGTVFKITDSGEFTTLHSFIANPNDGANPYAGLVQATDGNLYGTTYSGGNCCGTIFSITPGGTYLTLHYFDATGDAFPQAGLAQATSGVLYGTTAGGYGSIFSLDMGLGPFVTFVRFAGRVGRTGPILGQGLAGTTGVSINGIQANFTVVSDTFIRATVPEGATTGFVTVTTPSGTLTSNVPFHVIP